MRLPSLYLERVADGHWMEATPEQFDLIIRDTIARGRGEECVQALVRLIGGHTHPSACGEYVLSLSPPLMVPA